MVSHLKPVVEFLSGGVGQMVSVGVKSNVS